MGGLDTRCGHCAGESEEGVHQRHNVATTDPVSTDVPVGENIAHDAEFLDTARLRSASHVGNYMVPLAWSGISCACVFITEVKGGRGMGWD
jgi:hypothetical protein